MIPPSLRTLAARTREQIERRGRPQPETFVAAVVALLAGITVFWLATTLFPHHSANHDEGVYLQQAAMLLDGRLELFAGEIAGAVRPWFFVQDGGRLYPKYAPVPAAMYAASMALFGEPRVTLAVVAAGNAALTYRLGSMAFDRRAGVVAATIFAASPMALLTSSVFLPYAPTTLLNLLFAVAYLRGVRDGSLRSAALAGVAVGLAFFARPFTALLFAAPFVAHAGWTVLRAVRARGAWPPAEPVRRNALTAALGLAFVGLTLAYNARLTGSPLVFPYEAFAPMDGPGFGRRRILGHAIEYTPALALEANGYVLWYLATRWFTAGLLGTACAAAGIVLAARRWRAASERRPRATGARPRASDEQPWADDSRGEASSERPRATGARPRASDAHSHAHLTRGLLAALFVTVPLGNLAFWGNRNVLATMGDPTDGLLSQFGPFYHFDLLVPLSVFAAFALVAGWRWTRDRLLRERVAPRTSARTVKALGLAVLLAGVLVLGAANAAVVSGPVERNAAYTDRYEAAYEPFERTDLDDALVFVPTPYGDWLAHPFQSLRNDPGLDGPVVYALDRSPASDFAVIDAYPDRTLYRYAYRGEWSVDPEGQFVPKLEPLDVKTGNALDGETVVGVPEQVSHARVRLESEGSQATAFVEDPGGQITVNWTLGQGEAELVAVGGDPANGSVPLDGPTEVVLTITLVQPDGSTLTYRQEVTVRPTAEGVEAIWPPERSVCTLVTECGNEGTYLPDRPDVHREGVSLETRIEARNGSV